MMPLPARILNLPPYAPVEPLDVLSARWGRPVDSLVKLDANENPYGPAPRVRQALAELPWVNIYPDPESRALRAALADFTGVPAEFLLAGAGADELIDLLLRVLLEPGDRAALCSPTFGMYAFGARLNAGQELDIPRRADFSLDLPALQAVCAQQRPKVLFLANPNNPDGQLLGPEEIETLLALPTLVVLDEAYIEFSHSPSLGAARSCIQQVPQRENLIVLRTFSKWAGLAGLRVGYGAFPSWLLPALWKAKQPYNVNIAASAAALASLEERALLGERVGQICAERERLRQALSAFPGLEPLPSAANFILCRVSAQPAAELHQALLERGILVRRYAAPRLQNYLRISVGRPQDSRALLDALEELR